MTDRQYKNMNKKQIKELEKKLTDLYNEQNSVAKELMKAKQDLLIKEMSKNFPTIESMRELIPKHFSSVSDFAYPKNVFEDYTLVQKDSYVPNDIYDYSPPTIIILELTSPSKGTTSYWSIVTNESSYSGYDSFDVWSIKRVEPKEVVETRWVPC